MTQGFKPITAKNTISEWLAHPTGGPVIRQMLAQAGADESALGPALNMSLQGMANSSEGKMTGEVVENLVRAANGGELPAEEATATNQRFESKNIIVTGAASGIGRAVAERLVAEGATVVAVDISEEKLAELAEKLGDGVLPVTANLADPAAPEKILAAAPAEIHGLANVAGINDNFAPLHEVDDALWERVFDINVNGLMRLSRAVLPGMLERNSGSIVNVTSEAGLRGSASGAAYTASKHAVVGLTKSTAFMYAKTRVRINAVAPGGVATGIPFPPNVSEFGSKRLEEARGIMPSVADAEHLAASITFLLSDDGVNINGAILPSDGGWSAA